MFLQTGCTLNFMAKTTDSKLSVEFPSVLIRDCSVQLRLSGGAGGEVTLTSPLYLKENVNNIFFLENLKLN